MTTAEKTKIKLDIACGTQKQKDGEDKPFVGVDISPDSDADVIHDLTEFPWPFEDNSVAEAFCSHYVEHTYPVGGPNDGLIAFMNEVYRILEPDALIRIIHPHLQSARAFQDPTHTRFIATSTWPYFAKDWREEQHIGHYPIHTDFGIENMFYHGMHDKPGGGNYGQASPQAQDFALNHYWNVAFDVVVDLKARK